MGIFALALRMEFLSVVEDMIPGQIVADTHGPPFRILFQIKQNNKQTSVLTSFLRLHDYGFCRRVFCLLYRPGVDGSESLPSCMAGFLF